MPSTTTVTHLLPPGMTPEEHAREFDRAIDDPFAAKAVMDETISNFDIFGGTRRLIATSYAPKGADGAAGRLQEPLKPASIPVQIQPKDGTAKKAVDNLKYVSAMTYAYWGEERNLSSEDLTLNLDTKVEEFRMKKNTYKQKLAKCTATIDAIKKKRPWNRTAAEKKTLTSEGKKRAKLRTKLRFCQRKLNNLEVSRNAMVAVSRSKQGTWQFKKLDLTDTNPNSASYRLLQNPGLRSFLESHFNSKSNLKFDPASSTLIDHSTGSRIALLMDESDPQNPELIMAHQGSTGDPSASVLFGGKFLKEHGEMTDEERTRRQQENSNMRTWLDNRPNYAGNIPASAYQAVATCKKIREYVAEENAKALSTNPNAPQIKIKSVGHSRGGMLAQVEAGANGGHAICGNSEGIGRKMRRLAGLFKLGKKMNADTQIEHLMVKGDGFSNSKHWNRFARFLESIWGGHVRNIGEAHGFEMATDTRDGRHNDEALFGALAKKALEHPPLASADQTTYRGARVEDRPVVMGKDGGKLPKQVRAQVASFYNLDTRQLAHAYVVDLQPKEFFEDMHAEMARSPLFASLNDLAQKNFLGEEAQVLKDLDEVMYGVDESMTEEDLEEWRMKCYNLASRIDPSALSGNTHKIRQGVQALFHASAAEDPEHALKLIDAPHIHQIRENLEETLTNDLFETFKIGLLETPPQLTDLPYDKQFTY